MSDTRATTRSVRYRERLWVPWWWWLPGLGVAALVALEVNPGSEAAQTLRERHVPLLETLAADLEEWRVECGSPELGWVFPNLRKKNWQSWKLSEYDRAAKHTGRGLQRPYYLCHTFAALLIGEGRSLDEVMQQTGLTREEAIAEARLMLRHHLEASAGG